MSGELRIASAGNTQAPALACLTAMGFEVRRISGGTGLLEARRSGCVLVAEDPLSLLGLAKIAEARGAQWQPTEREISDLLVLLGGNDA